MNEFTDFFQLGATGYFFFQQVFNGFDIVVGGFFYVFDALGVAFRKIADDTVQKLGCRRAERADLDYQRMRGQGLQPAHFN